MSQPITQFSQRVPTPLAALALGVASLGWCWDSNLQLDGKAQLTAAGIAAALIGLLLLKFARCPRLLWQDLAHPILGSVLPTAAMATMVISVALPESLALPLWVAAVIAHSLLFAGFLRHRLTAFQLQQLIPGWFVPPIGIVTAVLTCPTTIPYWLAAALFWFGLFAYALMLPVMLYRLVKLGTLPLAAKPSLAVLAAPASLCLAAYISFAAAPAVWLVSLLLVLALLMTSVIYLALPSLLRLTFTPAFAAYTFPLVIGATALFKVSNLFSAWHFVQLAQLISFIAYLELAVATLVCSYVAGRFGQYLWQQWQPAQNGPTAPSHNPQLHSAKR